jgi:hypothetical protein
MSFGVPVVPPDSSSSAGSAGSGTGAGTCDQDVPQPGILRAHRLGQRPENKSGVPLGNGVADRAGRPAQVVDLHPPVRGQRQHRDRPEPKKGENKKYEFNSVRQLHHHPVAGGDAGAGQSPRQPVDGMVESAVTDDVTAADQGRTVRAAPGLRAQHGIKGIRSGFHPNNPNIP